MISLYISGITRILYKQLSSSFRRLGGADRLLTTENRYQIGATYKWKYISMSDLLFKHCLKFLYLLLRILRPAYVDYQDQRTVIEGLKTYGPFRELDGSTEMSKQPSEQNSSIWGSLTTADFSVLDSILAHQQPEFSASYSHNNLLNDIHHGILNAVPSVHAVASNQNLLPETKKRKEKEQSSRNSRNISSMASTANSKEKNSLGKGRKGKDKEKEVHKAEQVIHVRTKRGQATDSHSIAERVRREKIKSKLRCLQDLVPGCHKSMGMAVMLEEIINYVHSLQNQVEFLSMQLGAAACSYDQNLETLSSSKAQGTNSWEAQEMQKLLREQYHSEAWPL